MLKWARVAFDKLGTAALAAYIFWLAWTSIGPHKPQIGPMRQTLADKIIPAIVEDLRQSRGDIRDAALLHFANDPTDYFTIRLRMCIEQSGVLNLRDKAVIEKVIGLTNLRHKSYGNLEDAKGRGLQLRVPAVLFGSINTFESRSGGAVIDVEVNLADIESGQTVFSKRYQKDTSSLSIIGASIEESAKGFPWFKRLLAWILAVLLLPVFTITFIRTMIRKESNRVNAFILLIYTAVDVLLAYLLVGAALTGWVTVVVFIVAIGLAFAYNIRIMTFALRLEK